jgi:phage shock protein C
MFCTQCGAQLNDSARFCTSCGKPADSSSAGANPAGSTFAAAPRRLRRIMAQKKIAGVCAGFAEYFDTDLTLMRVIWVALLILPPNLGAIAYVVAWAVMPKS